MTTAQVDAMIASMKIPYAYHQFADGTGQQPPFVCFFYDNNADFLADDINYKKIVRLYIELYTDEKDFSLESVIESTLNDNGIVYTSEEDYIDTERLHVTVYSSDICLEVSNNG